MQTGVSQKTIGGFKPAFAKPNHHLGMLPVLHLVISPDSCSSLLVKIKKKKTNPVWLILAIESIFKLKLNSQQQPGTAKGAS